MRGKGIRRLGVSLALLGIPGAFAATADAARPVAGPLFGQPGDNGTQKAILANIANTPKGRLIEGVTWSFTDEAIATALIEAHQRGVRVRILAAHEAEQYDPIARLKLALDNPLFNADDPNSSVTISTGSARTPTSPTLDPKTGAVHQKSWTFSRVGRTPWVSIVSSANVTENANDIQFTDGWQFVREASTYSVLHKMFNQQIKLVDWGAPFTVKPIGKGQTLTFSPWNSASMPDPVVQRIKKLPNNVTIRAANAAWQGARGLAIAQALAAKKAKGADIRVLYNAVGVPENAVDQAVVDVLTAAGIPQDKVYFSAERYLHGKFMTAKYGGQTRVWFGSENWADAPRTEDELVAMLTSKQAYTAYTTWFDTLEALSS